MLYFTSLTFSCHDRCWKCRRPSGKQHWQFILSSSLDWKCRRCVLMQGRSSCFLCERTSACCVKSFTETPSVPKNTSPHTLTTRNIRYLTYGISVQLMLHDQAPKNGTDYHTCCERSCHRFTRAGLLGWHCGSKPMSSSFHDPLEWPQSYTLLKVTFSVFKPSSYFRLLTTNFEFKV